MGVEEKIARIEEKLVHLIERTTGAVSKLESLEKLIMGLVAGVEDRVHKIEAEYKVATPRELEKRLVVLETHVKIARVIGIFLLLGGGSGGVAAALKAWGF